MKKIWMIIFIFLTIYPISKSNCDGDTSEKCLQSSTNFSKYDDICCFLNPINNSTMVDPICKAVPHSSYFSGYKKEYDKENNILYDVNCNVEKDAQTYALEQCGNTHKEPKSLKDCKKYSSLVDSCCYFSPEDEDEDDDEEEEEEIKINFGNQTFKKGCYWLGSKYEGKITWAGIKLKCQQNYLNYNLFSLFFFVSIFLF